MKTKMITALLLALSATSTQAASFTYGFDNVSNLVTDGWVIVNNSNAIGTTSWFQGNTGVFNSQSGAANSYVAANFNSAAFGGNISNWLLSPVLSLAAGETFSFYVRTDTPNTFNDTLEVRFNSGSSTNVGATDSSLGDFATLLTTIAGTAFPTDWTLQSTTAGVPISGRFAFRYLVNDTSVNGNYIAIDSVSVTSQSSPVPEPLSLGMLAAGLGGLALLRRRAR